MGVTIFTFCSLYIQKLQKTARKLHFEQFFISFCYDIDKGKGLENMKEKDNQLIEHFKTFLAVPYAYFAVLSVLGALALIFEMLMYTSFYNIFEGIREIVLLLLSIVQIVGIINILWLAVAVIWGIVICYKEKSEEIFFKPYVAIALVLMTVFIIITFAMPW